MASGQTKKQKFKAERQETLRELLQSQGHLQHVIDLQEQLMDFEKAIDKDKLDRIKVVIDSKLKLIRKYIPDLSNVSIDGELGIIPNEQPISEIEDEAELEAIAYGSNVAPIK